MMRISATIPDDFGREVKQKTENVSAFVAEALKEKLARMRREKARRKLLKMAGSGDVSDEFDEKVQRDRRDSGRY